MDCMVPMMSRDDVRNAVRRQYPSRIPFVRAKWWGEGLEEQYGGQLSRFDRFQDDVVQVFIPNMVDPKSMGLSWEFSEGSGLDSTVVIDDWSQLDEFVAKLPSPAQNPRIPGVLRAIEEAKSHDRYVQLAWWNLFFERDWSLRGMENLMVDFYLEPERVHQLHEALASHYLSYLAYVDDRVHLDGFFVSDDLGHQTGPMFSPGTFHEFFFPYYHRIGSFLRDRDIDFWLHTCGNVTDLIEDFIAAGLTVLHPIQKHTMDEKEIAKRFGDRLSFFAGIDVQHTLQEADPEGVREEVRFLVDTFDRPEGGLCLSAGNGIVAGTPLENIEAFLDESITYGVQHRAQVACRNDW